MNPNRSHLVARTAVSLDSVFACDGYAPDGDRSLEIHVAPAGSALGLYSGGVLIATAGRDMADFNALTFYARASENVSLDVAGFGNDRCTGPSPGNVPKSKFTVQCTEKSRRTQIA